MTFHVPAVSSRNTFYLTHVRQIELNNHPCEMIFSVMKLHLVNYEIISYDVVKHVSLITLIRIFVKYCSVWEAAYLYNYNSPDVIS